MASQDPTQGEGTNAEAQKAPQTDGGGSQKPAPGFKSFGSINSPSIPPSLRTKAASPHPIANFPSNRFKIGYASTTGRRHSMEDELFIQGCFNGNENMDLVGVFDGHGGRTSAQFAGEKFSGYLCEIMDNAPNNSNEEIEKALRKAFEDTHQGIVSASLKDGTTALVAFFTESHFWVANAGDSRAVISTPDVAFRLSVDHKPSVQSEEERIKGLGGFVTNMAFGKPSCSRVNGILSVSRSLGDTYMQPYVTWEPTISGPHPIVPGEVMILACDGLWDVISDDEAITLIAKIEDPSEAAKELQRYALSNGSLDNISIVVVKL